jgi:hypothetical protein
MNIQRDMECWSRTTGYCKLWHKSRIMPAEVGAGTACKRGYPVCVKACKRGYPICVQRIKFLKVYGDVSIEASKVKCQCSNSGIIAADEDRSDKRRLCPRQSSTGSFACTCHCVAKVAELFQVKSASRAWTRLVMWPGDAVWTGTDCCHCKSSAGGCDWPFEGIIQNNRSSVQLDSEVTSPYITTPDLRCNSI